MKKYRFLSFLTAFLLTIPFIAVCHSEADNDPELPGDVNGDGIVNVMDVEILTNQLIGIENEYFIESNADMNNNKKVDSVDLVYLILKILNIYYDSFSEINVPDEDVTSPAETTPPEDTTIFSETTSPYENDNVQSATDVENNTDVNNNLIAASSAAYEVLKMINEIRINNGLDPFETEDILDDAAMDRAAEISHLFSHTRPDGSSCFSILDEIDVFYMSAGENIACGSSTAQGVVEQWMNSTGHRDNILNPDYDFLGIGYYSTDDGNYFWTQLFIGQ